MKKIYLKLTALAGFAMLLVSNVEAQWLINGNWAVDTATNFIGTKNNAGLKINTNNTTRMYIDKGGNVGIGTVNPQARLDIYSPTGDIGITMHSDAAGAYLIMDKKNITDNAVLSMRTDGTILWQCGLLADNNFAIRNFAIQKRALTITSDSNFVGIGTSSPKSKLDVNGNIKIMDHLTFNSTNGFIDYGPGGNLSFRRLNVLGDIKNYTEQMVLTTDGHLGIGTSTPDRAFVVHSPSMNTNSEVSELANAIGDQNFHLVAMKGVTTNNIGDALLKFGMVYGGSGISFKSCLIRFHRGLSSFDGAISFSTNGDVEQMRITGDGFVGIGTQNPTGLLELNLDDARKPLTSTWTITSDERLKNIDGPYSKGLKEIAQLNPIMYHYKNVDNKKFDKKVLSTQAIGFTAQDVQKIFPEAVGTDADGYMNLDIHSILIASVNAIKELNTEVETLKAENENLKSCIESICSSTPTQGLRAAPPQQPAGATQAAVVNQNVLFQNQPNPFNKSSILKYTIAEGSLNAEIVIRDLKGNLVKSFLISKPGTGQIVLNASQIVQGTYTYSLVVNGEAVDTKLMVVTH